MSLPEYLYSIRFSTYISVTNHEPVLIIALTFQQFICIISALNLGLILWKR